MTRLRDERGFTTIEVMVASVIAMLVLTATLAVFESISRTKRHTDETNDSQQVARVTLDRMARQLRNLASPSTITSVSGTLPRSVDRNLPHDLIFQDIDPVRPAVTFNSANVRRVRYCLDTTSAGLSATRGKLYMKTQSWTTAAPPAVPAATTCTTTDAGWGTHVLVADYVTNKVGDRPIFTYSGNPGVITATDSASRADIARIETNLFIDPDTTKRPVETQLGSSVILRNQNREPAGGLHAHRDQPELEPSPAAAQRLGFLGPRGPDAELRLVRRRRRDRDEGDRRADLGPCRLPHLRPQGHRSGRPRGRLGHPNEEPLR